MTITIPSGRTLPLKAKAGGGFESAIEVADSTVLLDANFASGDTLSTFTTNEIGFSWAGSANTSVGQHPESGVNSLIFTYAGSPPPSPGQYNSEQRFELGQQLTEVWTEFDLYIPSNFKVRSLKVIFVDAGEDLTAWQPGDLVVGGSAGGNPEAVVWGVDGQTLYLLNAEDAIYKDGYWSGVTLENTTRGLTATVGAGEPAYLFGANNKFHTLWSGDYSGGQDSGGVLDVEYNAGGYTGVPGEYGPSYLRCKSTATDTNGQTSNLTSSVTPAEPPINPATDLGKTIKYTFHWTRSSSPTADNGVCEIYKDQVLVYGRYDLPNYDTTQNYFERGYLLGYANTGFDEVTRLGISRFRVLSERPF